MKETIGMRASNTTIIDGQCYHYPKFFEPESIVDTITWIICYSAIAFNTFIAILIIINRKYPPLVAKQPWVVFMSYICGSILIFSATITNDNLNLYSISNNSHWCSVRRFWLFLYFGMCGWISCMIVRLVKLYIVIERKKKPWNDFLILFVVSFPSLVAAIIGHATLSDRGCIWIAEYEGAIYQFNRCKVSEPYLFVNLVVISSYIFAGLLISFFLRNIRKSFNEFKELRIQAILDLIVYAITVAMLILKLDSLVIVRSFISLLLTLLVVVNLLLSVSVPLYYSIRDREGYLKRFRAQLDEDSQMHVRRMSVLDPERKKGFWSRSTGKLQTKQTSVEPIREEEDTSQD